MSASAAIIAHRNGSTSRTMSCSGTSAILRHDEEQQAVGRRDQAEHDVDDHHHAEMHHVDAERLRGRDEHRHDDQQDRGAFEHAAEQQQEHVDQDQEADRRQIPARAGRR